MPGTLKLVGTLIMAVAVAIRVGERRVVEALEAAGVKVGTTPTEVAELAADTAGARA